MSTSVFAPVRPFVPLDGTLRRCPHGVYLPAWILDEADCSNPYCACSGAFGKVLDQREVVLPFSSTPLNPTYRTSDTACPKCFSTAHFGNGKTWTCAECLTPFSAPRRVLQASKVAEAQEQEC